MVYRGYHDKDSLPIKPGDRVKIAKGTPVMSMYPGRDGWQPVGRTYSVKVHHLMPGMSLTVGHIDKDGGLSWGMVHWRDLYHYCRSAGIDIPYGPSGKPETVLQTILDSGKVELVEPSWDIHKKDIRLHVRNPTIVWPGRGGYWNEVDINDVEVVDA